MLLCAHQPFDALSSLLTLRPVVLHAVCCVLRSRFLGVGSSNRKNQWQARILYHGKVTHLGYYRTEEEAARVYDKVSISLHGAGAQTNFPIDQVRGCAGLGCVAGALGLTRCTCSCCPGSLFRYGICLQQH